jgi:hypothetical protein
MKPCGHEDDATPNCQFCFLASTSNKYRVSWGLAPIDITDPPAKPPISQPTTGVAGTGKWKEYAAKSVACVHKRAPTGEFRECAACGGRRAPVEVLGCVIYGGCLEFQVESGLGCCRICEKREPP